MVHRGRRLVRAKVKRCAPGDLSVELAILACLAVERSEGVTIPMLARRFNTEFDQGISGSAVERAVRGLVRDGWLQTQGARVAPFASGRATGSNPI